ncbi:hypothetical protein [Ruegeria sp. HKCCSP351]|uniref:hypothetical protein n=1 Tax=Ruegeria sp. HKCCSP351 TaxID=2794832 RepID=UPI001AE5F29D|nr:hypothetical protein [Ruegeria sp. HKCCSP351]
MNHRENFLKSKLKDLLERRSMPRHLAGNGKAQSEEMKSLAITVGKFAPRSGYEDWWPKFQQQLDEDAKTRAWPTAFEIKSAAQLVQGTTTHRPAQGDEIDTLKVYADRIKAGEAVDEGCLFGAICVEMKSRGLMKPDTLRNLRMAWYSNVKEVYGEQKANQMETEMIKRQEAAEKAAHAESKPQTLPSTNSLQSIRYDWDSSE